MILLKTHTCRNTQGNPSCASAIYTASILKPIRVECWLNLVSAIYTNFKLNVYKLRVKFDINANQDVYNACSPNRPIPPYSSNPLTLSFVKKANFC